MTFERLLSIFQNYINNQLNEESPDYILCKLKEVAEEGEIDFIGFSWLYDYGG